jgi:hypothetical protein
MSKLPDYLKESDEGYAITLSKPITISGAQVTEIIMREPNVADQLAMDKTSGSEAEKEITMMANLCMISKDDIKQLKLRDYKRVQTAFGLFID